MPSRRSRKSGKPRRASQAKACEAAKRWQERSLGQSLPSVDPTVSPDYDTTPSPEKFSTMLIQLVGPWIEQVDSPETLEALLRAGVRAWNWALLPPEETQRRVAEHLAESDPAAVTPRGLQLMDDLLQRKRQLFGDVNCRLGRLDVEFTDTGFNVTVQALLTLPPELLDDRP